MRSPPQKGRRILPQEAAGIPPPATVASRGKPQRTALQGRPLNSLGLKPQAVGGRHRGRNANRGLHHPGLKPRAGEYPPFQGGSPTRPPIRQTQKRTSKLLQPK